MVAFGPINMHPTLLAPAGSPSRGESPGPASFGVDWLAVWATQRREDEHRAERLRAVGALARLRALVETGRLAPGGVSLLATVAEVTERKLEADGLVGQRPAAG